MADSVALGPALPPRLATLSRNWPAVAARGAFALIFAAIALLDPGLALGSLILLYAVYAVFDGCGAFVAATRAASRHARWAWLAAESVANLVAGCVALLLPSLTLFVFMLLLAGWAIATGAAMVIAGIGTHGRHGRLFLVLGGVVSVTWGGLLLLMPAAGAAVLAIWLGCYALLFGVAMIALAVRLRRLAAQPADLSPVAW